MTSTATIPQDDLRAWLDRLEESVHDVDDDADEEGNIVRGRE